MPLSAPYLDAMNRVLAVNYQGEVLAIELLARVTRSGKWAGNDELLRQIADEARHARSTRDLLRSRGYDVDRDTRDTFTFTPVFDRWCGGSADEALACLCENEFLSSRHFQTLARIATSQGDEGATQLLRVLSADEAGHASGLAARLPTDPDVVVARKEARASMVAAVSDRYLQLIAVVS